MNICRFSHLFSESKSGNFLFRRNTIIDGEKTGLSAPEYITGHGGDQIRRDCSRLLMSLRYRRNRLAPGALKNWKIRSEYGIVDLKNLCL
jgi:hypothetical protein